MFQSLLYKILTAISYNLNCNTSHNDCYIDWTKINLISQYLYSIIFVVGGVINTTFICNILRSDSKNIYALNLSAGDFLFLLTIPILVTTINLHRWVFGKFICKIFIASLYQCASSIFVIAINCRSIKCCANPKLKMIKVLFIWIFSIICVSPAFIYADVKDLNCVAVCDIIWPNKIIEILFSVITLVVGFLTPLFYFLCNIFNYNCFSTTRLEEQNSAENTPQRDVNKKFVCKNWSTIILLLLRKLPFWSFQTVLIFIPFDACESNATIICIFVITIIIYTSSCLYPILYFCLNKNRPVEEPRSELPLEIV